MKHNRTPAADGGERVGRMTPTQPSMFHPVYTGEADLQVRRAEFRTFFAQTVRKIADYAVTKQEKSVCAEAIKGRSLSIDGFDTLLTVAARSVEHHSALSEFCTQQVLQRIANPPSLCVVDTWLTEGRRQNVADEAHDLFIVERIPVRRDAALDRLLPHYDALRQAIDALHVWAPNGRRHFA